MADVGDGEAASRGRICFYWGLQAVSMEPGAPTHELSALDAPYPSPTAAGATLTSRSTTYSGAITCSGAR